MKLIHEMTRRTWKSLILACILPLLFLVEAALLISEHVFELPFDTAFHPNAPVEPGCIYVPGAGFSGFWFTLGRLASIPHPAVRSYYCYSAGCLGVVATLSNFSRDEMYGLASEQQRLWQLGEIGLYDVVPRFVDGLLSLDDDAYEADIEKANGSNSTKMLPIMTDATLLSKLHIITTRKEGRLMHHAIRTPRTIQELREALIHTTWIPYITGRSFWSVASQTGDYHMDGGASASMHPTCTYHIGLPFMLDLFMNILNVNLSWDKVVKFWDAGVAFGSGII